MKTRGEKGDSRAKTALSLSDNYDKTLTTILIGNNVVNIASSTIAATVFTAWLGTSGAVVSTVVMTLLVLTFGEILPKSYGKAHSDQMALRVARPIRALSAVLTPVSFLFSKINNIFLPKNGDQKSSPTMTEEELHTFIDHIEKQGVLEEQESDLVQSALEFDEVTIREIVTPRVEMVALDVDSTQEEIRDTLLSERFSRVPVYENNIDNIIGFVYSRDLLQSYLRGEPVDLRRSLCGAYFAHKSMKLSQLLQHMKLQKTNLAVVTDDYGGTLGIITMRDLLQELVGELWEEGADGEPDLYQAGEDHWVIHGGLDLELFFEELGFQEPEEESDFCTVNGWALDILQHLPQSGEEFSYEGYLFRVGEMDGRRIHKLDAFRFPERTEEGGSLTALPGEASSATAG